MAFVTSWAFFLLVVLAAAHCTESRSAHRTRRDKNDDYSFDDNATGDGEEAMQGDDTPSDWQGDDGDYDGDDATAADGDAALARASPPVLVSAPESVRASVGDSVRLSCHVANSSEEVVTWLFNNDTLYQGWAKHMNKVRQSTNTVVHGDYSLEVPSAREEDSGSYTCQLAVAGAGKTQSVTHSLKIYQGNREASITRLSLEPADRRVIEGTRLAITCEADGFPTPRLIWSKRDRVTKATSRVTSADAVRMERNALVIENVQRRHDGEYFCMAENGVGRPAMQSIDVYVVGKPAVHVHKSLVNAAIGITAIMGCTVHYEPRSVVSWQKDGVELAEGADVVIEDSYPTSYLRIPVVKEKDFGTYTCVAQNQFGSHNRSVSLVEEPVLEGVRVEEDALVLTIHSYSPLEAVTLEYRRTDVDGAWERKELKPITMAQKHVHVAKFNVADLPSGKYEALARARNQAGWSQPSKSVFFEGAEVEANSAESIKAAGVGPSSGVSDLKSTFAVFASFCLLVKLF